MSKSAYRINELAEIGPFGRSFIFDRIRDGSLVAKKAGRTTVILASDWQAFLASLPAIDRRKAA